MRKKCCCDKGACCHLDETCEITTQTSCEEQCGEYQGDGVPCLQCEGDSDCFDGLCIDGECDNGVDCALERGACCYCEPDSINCTDNLRYEECLLGESSRICVDGEIVIEYDFDTGVWQGPNSTCDDGCPCGTGACCCDGECSDRVGYEDCIGNTCYYLGDNTTCAEMGATPHPDEPVGGWDAWCYPDGPNNVCCPPDNPDHICCIDPDSWLCHCYDRCCVPAGIDGAIGICFQDYTEQECEVVAGEFMPGRLSQPIYEQSCFKCGQWDSELRSCICPNEDWTHNDPFPDSEGRCRCFCGGCCSPKGACCWGIEPFGFHCQIRTQYECEAHWWSYPNAVFHEGMWCDEISDEDSPCYDQPQDPCPQFGACCVDEQQCIQNLTEDDCNEMEGVFQGVNTTQCENCGEEEEVGYCCVPAGTSSDIILEEHGICLGTVIQSLGSIHGCPSDFDWGAFCFPPINCCRTGVFPVGASCNDGDTTHRVGITEIQCLQAGGQWNGTGPDPDGNHSEGYHECADACDTDSPFDCVCSYGYCEDPGAGQDCGYTDPVAECTVIGGLPSAIYRDAACAEACTSACIESGGDLDQCYHAGKPGWAGIRSGVCDSFGIPLTCDSMPGLYDPPLDACFLGECENWCCCSFELECNEDTVGDSSCFPTGCENQSQLDCQEALGVFQSFPCPEPEDGVYCPCPLVQQPLKSLGDGYMKGINHCCPCIGCLDACMRKVECGCACGYGDGCEDNIGSCDPRDTDNGTDCGPYQIDPRNFWKDICQACKEGQGETQNYPECCAICTDKKFGDMLCSKNCKCSEVAGATGDNGVIGASTGVTGATASHCGFATEAECCVEKERISLLLLKCYRLRYTHQGCDGHGKDGCFTCEDLGRMHQGGWCGHVTPSEWNDTHWGILKSCMEKECKYKGDGGPDHGVPVGPKYKESCTPDYTPPKTGACCIGEDCWDGLTEQGCATLWIPHEERPPIGITSKPTYQGDGTSCVNGRCPHIIIPDDAGMCCYKTPPTPTHKGHLLCNNFTESACGEKLDSQWWGPRFNCQSHMCPSEFPTDISCNCEHDGACQECMDSGCGSYHGYHCCCSEGFCADCIHVGV